MTTYGIEASSPEDVELTYRWWLEADEGQDCGNITPADLGTAIAALVSVEWSHANEAPDGCGHDVPDHPLSVQV